MDENEIIRLFNLTKQLLLNIDADHPYVYEAVSYYSQIIYNKKDSQNIHDLCYPNIRKFRQLLLNDIKIGFPYALYYYNFYIDIFRGFGIGSEKIIDDILEGYNQSDMKTKKSILKVMSGVDRYIIDEFLLKLYEKEHNENNNLKNEVTQLKLENSILKAHIEYMPNGSGYENAKNHFIETMNNLKMNKN